MSNNTVEIFFINPNGEEIKVAAPVGLTLLEVVRKYNRENSQEMEIKMEGSCDGALACSTCHVIFQDISYFNSVAAPSEEEENMLDYCYALTATSRLGCQIQVDAAMSGQKFALPKATRNILSD